MKNLLKIIEKKFCQFKNFSYLCVMINPKLNISYQDFLTISHGMLDEAQVMELFKKATKLRPAVFLYSKTPKNKQESVRKVLRKSDVGLFNQRLTYRRLELGHKFTPLQEFDSQFSQLSEIAADASDFCEVFNLDTMYGYDWYIQEGTKFMGKTYSLNKFKYYKEKLFSKYEAQTILQLDPDKEMTEKLYKLFCRVYNIRPNEAYRNKHIVDFVKISERVRESGLKYQVYMTIQVEFYKSINKTPEPSYFHSNEAFERTFKFKK